MQRHRTGGVETTQTVWLWRIVNRSAVVAYMVEEDLKERFKGKGSSWQAGKRGEIGPVGGRVEAAASETALPQWQSGLEVMNVSLPFS